VLVGLQFSDESWSMFCSRSLTPQTILADVDVDFEITALCWC